jgi:hypothetical protein
MANVADGKGPSGQRCILDSFVYLVGPMQNLASTPLSLSSTSRHSLVIKVDSSTSEYESVRESHWSLEKP